MSSAPPFRIGYGYDIHRLVPAAESGRPLVLGGVHFTETDCALDGHSDADVLTHAICDALLGAAGLPDIGHFFPNRTSIPKNFLSKPVPSCATAATKSAISMPRSSPKNRKSRHGSPR